jgi:hypothetical protein
MARAVEITMKEKRFAYMVANGSTQLQAYAKVYGNGQSDKEESGAGWA